MRVISLCLLFASSSLAGDGKDWRYFKPVAAPPVPEVPADRTASTPIDAFLIHAQTPAGLTFRPEAPPEVLLRRVYLDLTGLAPSPEERAAFLADPSPAAYEKLVDRLLEDPRHAERWARHWMDIWRYSDWAGWADGGQIRDSQPHIWRWRDWIVESLAADKGYDAMVTDMLAADERAPEDTDALRATGFLVRNYKMLSREQWLEDTVNHTSRAFMGLTIGCAKCHDHLTDPVPQKEYYSLRAIFEPHRTRIDHVPGESDTTKDGLARTYDAEAAAPTYFFIRGDERRPDKDRPISPAVPAALGGALEISPVKLPSVATAPEKREFVRQALEGAAVKALADSKDGAPQAAARLSALRAVLAVERLEEAGKKDTDEGKAAEKTAVTAQREEALQTALRKVVTATAAHDAAVAAKGDTAATEKALTEAKDALNTALANSAKPAEGPSAPRPMTAYPAESTGRRLAFAHWLTRRDNPLTARVAVNHVWTRHFGAGLVPTVSDFGPAGRATLHPELLDWLAADFMDHGWSLRRLHRMICLSVFYRQGSAPGADGDAATAKDPDDRLFWRYPSRRLEAEAVRDNVLHLTGGLDLTRGGPEIDQKLALTSPRRSLYLRCAAEKQPEFIQVFDGPAVTDCYERKPSVMPQQALALLNSALTHARAAAAAQADTEPGTEAFVIRNFTRFLTREPNAEEKALCVEFLGADTPRAREQFILTLLNHHEFVTLR